MRGAVARISMGEYYRQEERRKAELAECEQELKVLDNHFNWVTGSKLDEIILRRREVIRRIHELKLRGVRR